MVKVKTIVIEAMLLLSVSLIILGCKKKNVQTQGYQNAGESAVKGVTNFYDPNPPFEIIRESNDQNSRIIGINTRSRPVVTTDFSTMPLKISLNESFNSKDYPKVKIKLLKVDSENSKCLIEYEGKADSNMVNPQWFKKNDVIFPSIYGDIGVTIEDIKEKEIYITIFLGGFTRYEKRDD